MRNWYTVTVGLCNPLGKRDNSENGNEAKDYSFRNQSQIHLSCRPLNRISDGFKV